MTKIFQDTRKKDPSTIPKILQDDKARTFAPTGLEIAYLPKYGEESDRSKHLLEEKENISNPENKLKKTNTKHFFDPEKKVQKLNPKYIDKFFKNDKLKEFYSYESEISNARINYFDRIINENPEISIRKISIITKLKELYAQREMHFRNKFNNNPEINEFVKLRSIDDEICKLEDEFRKQQGSSVFTYQNKFVKF